MTGLRQSPIACSTFTFSSKGTIQPHRQQPAASIRNGPSLGERALQLNVLILASTPAMIQARRSRIGKMCAAWKCRESGLSRVFLLDSFVDETAFPFQSNYGHDAGINKCIDSELKPEREDGCDRNRYRVSRLVDLVVLSAVER